MSKTCPICRSRKVIVEYDGIIRNGGLGKYTDTNVKMFRCKECETIWHDNLIDLISYYQTDTYRMSLEDSVDAQEFYRLHDRESLDKLRYTGMIYRNKNVADVGCGCGAFLDVVSGMAKETIAIEPTLKYREIMSKEKHYNTYAYSKDALEDWREKVDVAVSFDVIEHVDNPKEFLIDIFNMLSNDNGYAVIGTPTETPVMRKLLGEIYDKKILFSVQHKWIFSEKSLRIMASEAGFKSDDVKIKYFQRYDLNNAMGWVNSKNPGNAIADGVISETMNQVWKSELENKGMSDYIVLYLSK
ncbi:MAG: class I SAM-dependent methyltransferase [Pseudobutyrivibrio ruminis]|uniref:class I SAM-dependent methyltransferase n=1 Tax=Pseudobutyrivibrio ruminis TaxID=46206 RepID=UPI0026ECF086|nr:class I SAM-dependent methyltransferase [Pseudobutyrivibrio ruminis]MBE5913598.1 class I SAM-dependent methyltransferase [Pseudobutyrivibrio ruminis]